MASCQISEVLISNWITVLQTAHCNIFGTINVMPWATNLHGVILSSLTKSPFHQWSVVLPEANSLKALLKPC
jgi:hypothetical protein